MKINLVTFFLFLLIPLYGHAFFFEDKKCETIDWVAEDSRSQGGGWIWFPGKGSGSTVEESYQYSENLALQRLEQECQNIPISVKFNERCDQKSGDTIESFVRVSVTDIDCKKAQNKKIQTNEKLKGQLENYLALKNLKELSGLDEGEKYNYARTINEDNPNLSKKILKELCSKSISGSCELYFKTLMKLKMYDQVIAESKVKCSKNDQQSCDFFVLGNLHIMPEKEFIAKTKQDEEWKRLIHSGSKSHLSGYFYAIIQENDKKALEIHRDLCTSGSEVSCYSGATLAIMHDLKDFDFFSDRMNKMAIEDQSGLTNFLKAKLHTVLGQSSLRTYEKACEKIFYGCVVMYLKTQELKYVQKLKAQIKTFTHELSPYASIAKDVINSEGIISDFLKIVIKDKSSYESFCAEGILEACPFLQIHDLFNDIKIKRPYNKEIACYSFPNTYACFIAESLNIDINTIISVSKKFCIELDGEPCDDYNSLMALQWFSQKKHTKDQRASAREKYRSYCTSSFTLFCRILFPELSGEAERIAFKECLSNSVTSFYYCQLLVSNPKSTNFMKAKEKLLSILNEKQLQKFMDSSRKEEALLISILNPIPSEDK